MCECFCCSLSRVIWNSDFDAEECGYDRPGIVSFYTCQNCGAEYEVFQPFPEEEENE